MGGELLIRELNTFQNNEVLTGITILSVLKITEQLEITKALLIEPLLSYKSIREYMKKSNSKVRSIEELIVKQNIAFSNFDKRFEDKLPFSINAILLMAQLQLMRVDKNKLVFTGDLFDFTEKTLGKPAQEVIAASKNMAQILMKEDASSLYLSLRVEI